jgi:hypothetical protein
MKKNYLVRLAVAAAALLFSADAMAATQSVTANLNFDTPLTLNKTSDINFGTVSTAADTYTITTAGVVTPHAAGQWLYGTKSAGSITIAGSATDTLTISVGSYVPSAHVSLGAPTCTYGGTTLTACAGTTVAAPTNAGTILLLGIDAIVAAGVVAGVAEAPSYTVTVTYN